jgi:UDPglucose 6-dehydrogenase
VIVTDIVTAELSKHAANAFLATKLTFVNSLAHLCESVGGDAASLLEVLGSDPRIGRQFLRPGPGWGGSCLPKDTRALAHFSRAIGTPLDQLDTTIAANDAHFEHVVSRLNRYWRGSLAGVRVAALGLAFKSGTDDMRDSPSLEVIARLVARGATVTAHDPVARPVNDQLRGASFTDSVRDAAADSEILLVLTEWSEFASLDPRVMRAASPARVVYDTRGILDADAWTAAGFDVMQVGRPTSYCGERETESSAA